MENQNQAEQSKMSGQEETAFLEARIRGLKGQATQNRLSELVSPRVMLALVVVLVVGFMFMDSRDAPNPQAYTGARAGIAQTGETGIQGFKEFDIVLKDSVYIPGTITVRKGDTVTINVDNRDNLNHGLHLPEYGVAKALTNLATTSVTFVATNAGAAATSCGGTLASGDPHPESLNIVVL